MHLCAVVADLHIICSAKDLLTVIYIIADDYFQSSRGGFLKNIHAVQVGFTFRQTFFFPIIFVVAARLPCSSSPIISRAIGDLTKVSEAYFQFYAQ